MAGMEGLGRIFNVVMTASGVAIALNGASAVTFIGTNDNTFTITVASSFAGSYATPGNVITHYYDNSDNGVGTGQWTKVTQSASNAVVQASDHATAITVFGTMLPDPKSYIKCTASSPGDGALVAIVHDLTVGRAPANLAALSA